MVPRKIEDTKPTWYLVHKTVQHVIQPHCGIQYLVVNRAADSTKTYKNTNTQNHITGCPMV